MSQADEAQVRKGKKKDSFICSTDTFSARHNASNSRHKELGIYIHCFQFHHCFQSTTEIGSVVFLDTTTTTPTSWKLYLSFQQKVCFFVCLIFFSDNFYISNSFFQISGIIFDKTTIQIKSLAVGGYQD